jgi:hypothetical protein
LLFLITHPDGVIEPFVTETALGFQIFWWAINEGLDAARFQLLCTAHLQSIYSWRSVIIWGEVNHYNPHRKVTHLKGEEKKTHKKQNGHILRRAAKIEIPIPGHQSRTWNAAGSMPNRSGKTTLI